MATRRRSEHTQGLKLAISLADFLQLAYGDNCDLTDTVLPTIRRVVTRDTVETIADLRGIIMALDQQRFPTQISIRFSESDIQFVTINGVECAVDRQDLSVCAPAASSGLWEPHIAACFRRICRCGSIAIDVGANVGYHTLLLAELVGSEGQCYAFEPNSENCRLILLGCEHNHFANIRLMPFGLSDESGWAYFSSHIGSNGGVVTKKVVASQGQGTVIPVFTLDSLSLPNVDVLKVDVEGAEYKVLRGGEALLTRSRPAIVSEFSLEMTTRVSGVHPADYLNWMERKGYKIYVLEQHSNNTVLVPSIVDLLTTWGSFTRIEDLLFLPREKGYLIDHK
jgi:FkbM family methyltransferase